MFIIDLAGFGATYALMPRTDDDPLGVAQEIEMAVMTESDETDDWKDAVQEFKKGAHRAVGHPVRRGEGQAVGGEPRAKGVENLPQRTAKRHVYLSADDVRRLADESGQHRALVLLLAYCGSAPADSLGKRGADRCAPRCRADQGPQDPVGAGARIRARRAVGAVRQQGAR